LSTASTNAVCVLRWLGFSLLGNVEKAVFVADERMDKPYRKR
jgi:hypothetical protein